MSTLNIAINTGRRLIHRVHVRMGANGLAGIGLVVIAGLALAYAQRAQQESVQLQAQTEQARTRMTEVSAQHLEPSAPADRLARFQNWFPPVDTSTADLRRSSARHRPAASTLHAASTASPRSRAPAVCRNSMSSCRSRKTTAK
jgi:hypothetical protein